MIVAGAEALIGVERSADAPGVARVGRARRGEREVEVVERRHWSSTCRIHASATGRQRSPTSTPASSSRHNRLAASTRSSVRSSPSLGAAKRS